jgi:hypothetical protein
VLELQVAEAEIEVRKRRERARAHRVELVQGALDDRKPHWHFVARDVDVTHVVFGDRGLPRRVLLALGVDVERLPEQRERALEVALGQIEASSRLSETPLR